MKSAVSIIIQINAQEIKLSIHQSNLATYNGNLADMKYAKVELEQIKKHYEFEFKSTTSYPNKLLAIDSLGLIGVENIQSAVSTAYSGTREKNLVNGMANALIGLQTKIRNEESKIATCKQNITNTKNTIASLQRELASAV